MALTDNRSKIQALIAGINALPDAGSGEAPADPVLQEKSATPTKAAQSITPDSGYDGLSKVTVNPIPDEYIVPSGTKSITANGKHDVAAYESVSVAVESDPVVLQEKTVTPSTSSQTVTPDTSYDGLSKVTVNAIPSQYEDVTSPLADLNAANGGTAASSMAGAVDNTEALADTHAGLIAQIATALEGKAAGGGGSGGTDIIETCVVTIDNPAGYEFHANYMTTSNGSIVPAYNNNWTTNLGGITISALAGSIITVSTEEMEGFIDPLITCTNCSIVREILYWSESILVGFVVQLDEDAETATIEIGMS